MSSLWLFPSKLTSVARDVDVQGVRGPALVGLVRADAPILANVHRGQPGNAQLAAQLTVRRGLARVERGDRLADPLWPLPGQVGLAHTGQHKAAVCLPNEVRAWGQNPRSL